MFRNIYLAFIVPVLLIIAFLSFVPWLSQQAAGHRVSIVTKVRANEETTAPAETTTTETAQPATGTDTSTADTPANTSNVAASDEKSESTTTETADAGDTAKTPPDKTTVMLGGGPQDVKLTPEEQRFVDLTNKERKDRGLNELIVAPLLVTTARAKSQEMHDKNYWGHEEPGKKNSTAMYRVLAALKEQPKYMVVGENLYYCSQVLVDSGHTALMNSPTHRKNILNPDYKYIGIGAYISKDGKFWVTEHFLKIDY